MNQVLISVIAFIVLIGGSSVFMVFHLPPIVAERKAHHDEVPRVSSSDFLICIPLVATLVLVKFLFEKFVAGSIAKKVLILKPYFHFFPPTFIHSFI